MDGRVVFIGEEVTAAGYRLAGAGTVSPAPGEEAAALREAAAQAELILLESGCAARIPAAELEPLLWATRPLLLIVPDRDGTMAIPDIAARVRLQLGVDA